MPHLQYSISTRPAAALKDALLASVLFALLSAIAQTPTVGMLAKGSRLLYCCGVWSGVAHWLPGCQSVCLHERSACLIAYPGRLITARLE
jgi:hypothetical protein